MAIKSGGEGQGLAVLNIEQTVMTDVMGGALEELARIDPSAVRHLDGLPIHTVAQRRLLTGWLEGKPEAAVDPLQQAAKKSAMEEIAPWAQAVMGAEAAAGNHIQLLSANVPHPVAAGIGQAVAELVGAEDTDVYAVGVPLTLDDDNKYTGKWRELYKTETVERHEAEGLRVVTAADTLASGRRVLERADRQILVDPERAYTKRPLSDRAFTIVWEGASTELTSPDGQIQTYDLGDMAQHQTFLEALGYAPSA